MSGEVTLEAIDQVLVVTIDRPKANAIDAPTSNAIYDAFRRLEDDPLLRVGILTAAGDRFFCAGWDLKAAAAGEPLDADHGPGGVGGLTEFFGRTKPVIAAINGLALGGGFEMALGADLIIAAEQAEFGLPEAARIGAVASAGLISLPRRLPVSIAREMLITVRRMPAREAASWGLVNRVVPAAILMNSALERARQICEAAPLAVAAVEEVLEATAGMSTQDGFKLLASGQLPYHEAVLKSEDAEEGVRAFTEKRKPQWSGR